MGMTYDLVKFVRDMDNVVDNNRVDYLLGCMISIFASLTEEVMPLNCNLINKPIVYQRDIFQTFVAKLSGIFFFDQMHLDHHY